MHSTPVPPRRRPGSWGWGARSQLSFYSAVLRFVLLRLSLSLYSVEPKRRLANLQFIFHKFPSILINKLQTAVPNKKACFYVSFCIRKTEEKDKPQLCYPLFGGPSLYFLGCMPPQISAFKT